MDWIDCVSDIKAIYTANQDSVCPEDFSVLHLDAGCVCVTGPKRSLSQNPELKGILNVDYMPWAKDNIPFIFFL